MPLVVPSSASAASGSRARGTLLVLLAMASLLVTAEWLREHLPEPKAHLALKLSAFEAVADEVDVLFVGSSRIYRHVDPKAFDAALARAGHPVRSFNMGCPGMAGLEIRYAIQRVLAMEPARLRWIVTDFQGTGVEIAEENVISDRVATWHDLAHTLVSLGLVLEAEDGPGWKAAMARRHVQAFLYRLVNVGRGLDLWEPVLAWDEAWRDEQAAQSALRMDVELGERRDGFVSLDEDFRTSTGRRRADLQARREEWLGQAERVVDYFTRNPEKERGLRRHDNEPRERQELTARERELYGGLAARCAEAGIELLFVTAPDFRPREFLLRPAVRAGLVPAFLDLDDPRRFPELFRVENRFDRMHLNERGAILYTRALARHFVRVLEEGSDG